MRVRRDLLLQEHELLKNEQFEMKKYQIRFFNIAVAATALILGYLAKSLFEVIFDINTSQTASDITNSTIGVGLTFLVPLVILIPIWSIFFNHAVSLSRIVGYYMYLESLLVKEGTQEDRENSVVDTKECLFVGWERSLQRYRSYNDREEEIKSDLHHKSWNKIPIEDQKKFRYTVMISLPSKLFYWTLIFRTFLFLCIICIFISSLVIGIMGIKTVLASGGGPSFYILLLISVIIIAIACFAVVKSANHNLIVLFELKDGIHTYNANYDFWCYILTDSAELDRKGCSPD